MQIALVKFEKYQNSTKRPIIQDSDFIEGEIKEDFSPMSLSVTFSFSDSNVMPEYNYAFIPAFKRYYFVQSWVFVGGQWSAALVVDVLASYQDAIKESNQLVTRSFSHPNGQIIDAAGVIYGPTYHSYERIPAEMFWGNSIEEGSVVIGVVGASNGNIGAVTYYAMNYSTFNAFMRTLLRNINWMGINETEISSELQKALINPAQYIVSCVWLPIPISGQIGEITNTVYLGWWNFTVSGSVVRLSIPDTVYTKQFRIPIPKHPQSSDFSYRYTRFSPFTRYSFKFLPFGVFELDTTHLYFASQLIVTVRVNPLSGDAVLDVSSGDSQDPQYSILTSQANVGVPIPTGQIAANLGNMQNAITAGAVTGAADIISAIKGG